MAVLPVVIKRDSDLSRHILKARWQSAASNIQLEATFSNFAAREKPAKRPQTKGGICEVYFE